MIVLKLLLILMLMHVLVLVFMLILVLRVALLCLAPPRPAVLQVLASCSQRELSPPPSR